MEDEGGIRRSRLLALRTAARAISRYGMSRPLVEGVDAPAQSASSQVERLVTCSGSDKGRTATCLPAQSGAWFGVLPHICVERQLPERATKQAVAKELRGKTREADQVADLLEGQVAPEEKTKFKFASQKELDDKARDIGGEEGVRAFAYEDTVYAATVQTENGPAYVRLEDVLHESVHQIDYMRHLSLPGMRFNPGRRMMVEGQMTSVDGRIRTRALELRTYRAEEALRQTMGLPKLFPSDMKLRRFIIRNYSPVSPDQCSSFD